MRAPEILAAELHRLVLEAQAKKRLPSASAAVARTDEVIWAEAVGLADAEAGVEATPDTQYRIGSITKTFTAAAVMQLRDAGELELEDTLGRHIPEAAHGSATIRGLLAHLSGLQREPAGEIWETMEPPSSEELLSRLAEAEQVLQPGAHWHYSNLAYALLGEVVARRSGFPYERYVEERLLRPVGLERTSWEPEQPAAKGYFVEPYSDLLRPEPLTDLRGTSAAGQLWSTTGDLCRWAAFLAGPDPDVLRPETAEEMRSFQAMADPDAWKLGWGLGLMLFREGDRIFFGHSGGMPGFITQVAYSRKDKVGAAALTNSTSGRAVGELCLKLAVKTADAFPVEPEPWRPEAPVPAELEDVLGRWWSESEEWVFRYRDGRLEASPVDAARPRPPAVFAPDGPDRFRVVSGPERGELLRVVRDESGEVVKLYWATYPFLRSPKPFGS